MQKRYTFFLSITWIIVSTFASQLHSQELLIEAESFGIKGGWVVDQQFMDIMGSPYLLAHGMGDPVPDAVDSITFPEKGLYHLWVRTKDWSPFPSGPGRFQVAVNGKVLDSIFGAENRSWAWHYGGTVTINRRQAELRLKDLTGFDGRCDALFFSVKKQKPPDASKDLDAFRRRLSGLPATSDNAGSFDLVVCGGGMAGICAAVGDDLAALGEYAAVEVSEVSAKCCGC